MVTNPIFDHYGDVDEQKLLDDMLIEAIQIHGTDMYFMPRRRTEMDDVYYEDTRTVFDRAYLFEFYPKDVQGTIGISSISNEGYAVPDQFTFECSITRFNEEVTLKEPTILRPREGDWLFFPIHNRIFEITFCNPRPTFYQLGVLQKFEIKTMLIRYRNEKLETGIPEIDAIQEKYSDNALDYSIKDQDGAPLVDHEGNFIITDDLEKNIEEKNPVVNNKDVQQNSNGVISFDERNPFADFGRY